MIRRMPGAGHQGQRCRLPRTDGNHPRWQFGGDGPQVSMFLRMILMDYMDSI